MEGFWVGISAAELGCENLLQGNLFLVKCQTQTSPVKKKQKNTMASPGFEPETFSVLDDVIINYTTTPMCDAILY